MKSPPEKQASEADLFLKRLRKIVPLSKKAKQLLAQEKMRIRNAGSISHELLHRPLSDLKKLLGDAG